MKVFFVSQLMVLILAVLAVAVQATCPQAGLPVTTTNLTGQWRVRFTLSGVGEKNLIFDSQAKGPGSFLLLDTGPDGKAVATPQPAVWSATTNDRVSFSGEVELPLGTCCRETGTLILKGKFNSSNSISGRAIFIGSMIDEENFNGFRSTVGTFTATRVTDK
ncbi:MAG: hypothetical protein ABI596_01155 [Pyrinomonadaceae bacterium]